MKTKKLLPTLFIAISFFLLPNLTFAALNGGNSGGSLSQQKEFSENGFGTGLSLGVRFNLASDVFSDSEELVFSKKSSYVSNLVPEASSSNQDHIFTEIGIFGNQFFSGEIKQNFGAKLNLGYEAHGFRIYGSGGYVASTFDYQEQNGSKESLIKTAPFFGGGISYDLTKNISLRLDGMFYNFDFEPKNSGFKNIKVNVAAGALGIGVYF